MFSENGLSLLLKGNRSTLSNLVALESTLNMRFADMEHAVECLVLSVATGEPMLLVGPPGTAKSRLIRAFCNLVGEIPDRFFVSSQDDPLSSGGELREVARSPSFFSYLLTQFTEPSELFGYFDIGKLFNEHKLAKMDEFAMQRARVVFLDEVFNASSAILNALLTFMNEREVHDRGTVYKVPLQCLFSATNYTPRTPELRAVFDRFLLRCWLDNEPAAPDNMRKLLRAGWKETYAPPSVHAKNAGMKSFDGLLNDIAKLQMDIEALTRNGDLNIEEDSPLFAMLATQVHQVRHAELSDASNRRIIKFARVMLVHRLLDYARTDSFDIASPEMQPADLGVFLRFGLDRRDITTEENFRKELEQQR